MKEQQNVFNPDIDSQLSAPQFDKNLRNVNPIAPEAIMEKLAVQQEAEKEYAKRRLEELSIRTKNFQPIKDSSSFDQEPEIPASKKVEYVEYPQMKQAKELTDYNNDEVQDKIVTTQGAPAKSTKQKIQEMQARLDGDIGFNSKKSLSPQLRSFFDEFGEETYYVKNVSNGHVVISDLDRGQNGVSGENKIARGAIVDLLQQYDLETLKKSRELRVAMSSRDGKVLLQRLTPEEYLKEITILAENKEKIEQFKVMSELKAASGQAKPKKPIRPVIEAKLLQLQLSYSDQPHKGISPVEFIQWVNTEKLTADELDYILSGVDDKDIRMFVYSKKQDL